MKIRRANCRCRNWFHSLMLRARDRFLPHVGGRERDAGINRHSQQDCGPKVARSQCALLRFDCVFIPEYRNESLRCMLIYFHISNLKASRKVSISYGEFYRSYTTDKQTKGRWVEIDKFPTVSLPLYMRYTQFFIL